MFWAVHVLGSPDRGMHMGASALEFVPAPLVLSMCGSFWMILTLTCGSVGLPQGVNEGMIEVLTKLEVLNGHGTFACGTALHHTAQD